MAAEATHGEAAQRKLIDTGFCRPKPPTQSPGIPQPFARGCTTAVVSACRKVRGAVRTIRKCEGQFGSGQATSASVLIQSFASVCRCLAASSGSSAPSE
jgi:hypothetical protein